MAASSQHAVRVLEQSRVSPPPGLVAETSLRLTFFDILWLYAYPVERIFFYRSPHPTAHFIDSVLPNIKSSLSLTLRHFYPLAGHLRLSPGSDEQYEIYYTEGDSIALTVAECNLDFQELMEDHAREMAKLRPLVPELPNSDDMRPLLSLQVTVFPNHGISIGVAIHHTACDGSSSMQFMKSWAAAYQSGGSLSLVGPSPIFDRSIITDPRRLYSGFLNDWRRLKANQTATSSDDTPRASMVLRTFSLGREHIDTLKQRVLAKAREGKPSFHCSTFVLACAHVWVCLNKARGCTRDKIAHLVFAVDSRARLCPPAPPAYFGNCIGGCFVQAKVDSLYEEDGVEVAAELIGTAIKRLDDGILNDAENWIQGHAASPEELMSTAGSPKLRVYDTDFGWGRPVKVEIISIEKTGAISLAENRDGRGGIEIGLVLPKQEMDEFGTHFLNGLTLLKEDVQ